MADSVPEALLFKAATYVATTMAVERLAQYLARGRVLYFDYWGRDSNALGRKMFDKHANGQTGGNLLEGCQTCH